MTDVRGRNFTGACLMGPVTRHVGITQLFIPTVTSHISRLTWWVF